MLSRLDIETHGKTEMLDITSEVRAPVRKSHARSGTCVIWVPHTTAGITVNENADPSVRTDILMELGKLVPAQDGYHHSEGNSDGHIKSTLCGHGVTMIIDGGDILLGTWQGIFLCEFDGPRRRRVLVKIMSD